MVGGGEFTLISWVCGVWGVLWGEWLRRNELRLVREMGGRGKGGCGAYFRPRPQRGWGGVLVLCERVGRSATRGWRAVAADAANKADTVGRGGGAEEEPLSVGIAKLGVCEGHWLRLARRPNIEFCLPRDP